MTDSLETSSSSSQQSPLPRRFNSQNYQTSRALGAPQVFVEADKYVARTLLRKVFEKSNRAAPRNFATPKCVEWCTASSRVRTFPKRQYYPRISPEIEGHVRELTEGNVPAARPAHPGPQLARVQAKSTPRSSTVSIHLDTWIFFGYRRGDHSAVADSIPEPRGRKHADHLGRCPSNRYL